MIPKIIHYCWFGGNEKNPEILECIASWKKYLPDYEIKEWSEKDLEKVDNAYVKEAYQAKKWAFVSDYFRLYALYHEGGIYFDTDVEVKKSFNEFLNLSFFIGSEKFGKSKHIGSAVIGAEKNSPVIQKMLSVYNDIHFIKKDGSFDTTPNTIRLIDPLKQCGFKEVYTDTTPICLDDKNIIYPITYFSQEDEKSYAVHHFAGSWHDPFILKDKCEFHLFGKNILIYRFKINKPAEFQYPHSKNSILVDWNYKKKYKLLIARGE